MTAPERLTEQLDAALANYTAGNDCAVRFVTIDQVDMLAEFYLQTRRADLAAVPAQVRVKWDGIETAPRGGEWFIARTEHGTTRVVHFADEYDRLPISHDGVVWSTTPTEWTPLEPVLAAIEPQPNRDLETCGKCMGSGYGGHPDSGHLCDDCNGIGGVPQPDPRIAYYEQAYQYALTLADALMAKHYPDNKDWRPLGDLIGLLTQIDNMVAGKKPDPRDEVIARLVEALEAIADYGTILTSNKNHDELRAALAAAKAVQYG